MTWKKTAINNKYSKEELLLAITECLVVNKLTVSLCDMYTSGTTTKELLQYLRTPKQFKGAITSGCKDSINVILGVCDCDNPDSFMTEEKMTKACERLRQTFLSDYSLFITHEHKGSVGICVQSKVRTYLMTYEIQGEDYHYTRSQVRYKALNELAKIIYNECNQAIPVKERKMVF